MNQLRPAKHCANGDQNTYCGPAAISTLCDITSEDAALHILSVRGARGTVKSVVGCWTGDVVKVLKRFSLATSRCYTSEKLPTLRQWILGKADFHQPDREATYLVTLSDHFVVVRGFQITDNQQGVRDFICSKHLRKRVSRIDLVTGVPVYLPAPDVAPSPKPKRKFKTTVYSLTWFRNWCRTQNVSVGNVDRDCVDSGYYHYWVDVTIPHAAHPGGYSTGVFSSGNLQDAVEKIQNFLSSDDGEVGRLSW
tara:strand:+ start:3934 stop:4686 length:753 start_codon:yes stop_codon:yes gene_type:complete